MPLSVIIVIFVIGLSAIAWIVWRPHWGARGSGRAAPAAYRLDTELGLAADTLRRGGRRDVVVRAGGHSKRLVISIPPGTSSGTRLRLRGVAFGDSMVDVYVRVYRIQRWQGLVVMGVGAALVAWGWSLDRVTVTVLWLFMHGLAGLTVGALLVWRGWGARAFSRGLIAALLSAVLGGFVLFVVRQL